MKNFYRINKFFVLLIYFIFKFSYPCKISKQLGYLVPSQSESITSSTISSNGKWLVLNVKKAQGNIVTVWNLQKNSTTGKEYTGNPSKEIKFSQADKYIGYNQGNLLNIQEIHGEKLAVSFPITQTDPHICGFDISEKFECVVFYDNSNNIYVYNLKNLTTPIASFKEPDLIRSVRFITQKRGLCYLAVETLYAIKFYDILSCTLNRTYQIPNRPFCGICVNDGYYAAFNSISEDGRVKTEIFPTPTDEEKTSKKYRNFGIYNNLQAMDAPQCTADPDVILFTGKKIVGVDIYEQVNLFSISRKKHLNFRLFQAETEITKFCKLLTPESLKNDVFFLKLSAQLTSNNQLIIFLKSELVSGDNRTYAVFIDIDFDSIDSDICDFQIMYDKDSDKFYLVSL